MPAKSKGQNVSIPSTILLKVRLTIAPEAKSENDARDKALDFDPIEKSSENKTQKTPIVSGVVFEGKIYVEYDRFCTMVLVCRYLTIFGSRKEIVLPAQDNAKVEMKISKDATANTLESITSETVSSTIPMVMPMDPISKSVLRPTRSTMNALTTIAKNLHAATLAVNPMAELSLSTPTSPSIVVP